MTGNVVIQGRSASVRNTTDFLAFAAPWRHDFRRLTLDSSGLLPAYMTVAAA